MTLSAMQTLYPTLKKVNYAVTASLSPTDTGWEIRILKPGGHPEPVLRPGTGPGQHHPGNGAAGPGTPGPPLASGKATNGQTAISANILDRILYAKDRPDHLAHLQALVVENINDLITRCCAQAQVDPSEILLLAVGGNTTMIHLLLACEPWQVFPNSLHPGLFTTPAFRKHGILA